MNVLLFLVRTIEEACNSLQYVSWWYSYGWILIGLFGPIASWIEIFILNRRKDSAAARTYSFGAIFSFWVLGAVTIVSDFHVVSYWVNVIGLIGGYLMMFLALIQHYYDLKNQVTNKESKNGILE
jgi:fatty acid desaturase